MSGAQFTITSGARAGRVLRLTQEYLTVGRDPSSSLQFDPMQDLDVSTRHAAIFRQDDHWILRDLDSTNGTFVNGERVRGDQTLAPGDLLRFGAQGPEVRFAPFDGAADAIPTVVSPPRGVPRPANAPFVAAPTPHHRPAQPAPASTTGRIRFEVSRQTARLRWMATAAIVFALAVSGVAIWLNLARGRALEAQRDRLLGQVDSLAQALNSASSEAKVIQDALTDARRTTTNLRAAIVASGSDQDRLREVDVELSGVLAQQGALLRAATLDAGAVTAENAQAVTVVLAEFRDGTTYSATGFTLRAAGDTGWVVTNRHIVVDSAGTPAVRVGVIYHGTSQNFRAEVIAIHPSADLALLRVQVRGGVPSVKGTAATPPTPGTPVALLSFPFGLDLPMGGAWRQVGVTASTFTGTVSRVLPDLIQLDGYGASGSSGSPVFNTAGEVVAVVHGGEPGTGGRILYATPIGKAIELGKQ